MLLDDLVFPRQDVGPVDFQPADLKSQFRAILEMIVNLRVVQQHFGGNTPDMQAGSAEKGILLHDDRLQPQFAGPDRRHISARAAPDNRYIVLCHS